MAKKKPYRRHLNSSDDLVTTYEAVRAGFVALALEKNRRATPFVEQARVLKAAASKATTPSGLIEIEGIQSALLTAAGVSDMEAAIETREAMCQYVHWQWQCRCVMYGGLNDRDGSFAISSIRDCQRETVGCFGR